VVVAAGLTLIVAVGLLLRLAWRSWDDGTHLHPDERYMSIVADNVRWPGSVGEYFDVEESPLSPYNTEPGRSYLYGEFPLFATKLVATIFGREGYGDLYLVGRAVSAVVDALSIVLVFVLARMLLSGVRGARRDAGALLAAAFYACAVTAIQHAHFFTVESWLVFFTLVTFLIAAWIARRGSFDTVPLLALGGAIGLTASVKASGVLVVVAPAVALVAVATRSPGPAGDRLRRLLVAVALVLGGAYVSFRLTSPYAFEHSNWLYLEPNEDLHRALSEQQHALNGEGLSPPGYQWLLSQRIVDPLHDAVAWGLGWPLGVLALGGLVYLAASLGRPHALPGARVLTAMLLSFVLLAFLYFGTLFVHSLRYVLPVIPFACIAAAVAVAAIARRNRWLGGVVGVGVAAATFVYAVAFVQIYRTPNTRVEATRWIEQTIPRGTTIANEHWDDALPVGAPPDMYELVEVPVFYPDDDKKLRDLYDALAGADVYVLSSPRAWKTIGRLPDRFPLMGRYYDALRAGKLGFREAARFESTPGLFGVHLDDLEAEEAFWVYDHPPVSIYRRSEAVDWTGFRAAVCGGERSLPGCA
jgi:hypothetical protein